MSRAAIDRSSPGRHARRFRATVEPLDARRLMAAGVAGAVAVSGPSVASAVSPADLGLTGVLALVTPPRAGIDRITSADDTPSFLGTANPGTTIQVVATSPTTGRATVVGSGVSDAQGNWSITSSPLADGSYTFVVTGADASGGTASLPVALIAQPPSNPVTLTIATAPPTVTAFRITNARTGAFRVTFSDPEDVAAFLTTNPAAYVVNRPSPAPRKGQRFAVANLSTSLSPGTLSAPNVTVTGTLVGGNGKPLVTRDGTYIITIDSAAITSTSGVALDGEYSGRFPSGDGYPGGDFRAKVVVRNGRAGTPLPVGKVKIGPHAEGHSAGPGVRA